MFLPLRSISNIVSHLQNCDHLTSVEYFLLKYITKLYRTGLYQNIFAHLIKIFFKWENLTKNTKNREVVTMTTKAVLFNIHDHWACRFTADKIGFPFNWRKLNLSKLYQMEITCNKSIIACMISISV